MAHPEIARYTETNVTPAILVNSSSSTASSHPASLPDSLYIVSYRKYVLERYDANLLFDCDTGGTSEFSIIEKQFLCFYTNGNRRSYFSKEEREKIEREREREKEEGKFQCFFQTLVFTIYTIISYYSCARCKGFPDSPLNKCLHLSPSIYLSL